MVTIQNVFALLFCKVLWSKASAKYCNYNYKDTSLLSE